MKWLGFGKKQREEAPKCAHPIDQQGLLREDPQNPQKVTGIKCFQCGARLPLPKTGEKSAA